MRISSYIVTKQVGNDYILFSTISKRIIKVSQTYFEEMNNINPNCLNEIKQSELDYLLDSYFLIEDETQEKNITEYVLDKDRIDQQIFSSYIVFSAMCNFACVYCYEEGQTKRNVVMSDEILQKTFDWYKMVLSKNRYKKCKITLFGGEPLIHKDLIQKFVVAISEFTKLNGIELKLAVITNGYLLDQKIVDFLNENGLEEIQITLDGVGKIHDERRPLRNGGPTFEKIIANITNLNKFNGRFLFRISFDKSNILHVKELLSFIKTLKIKNEYQVYLAPIHQTTVQSEHTCSFCSKNTTANIDDLIELYADLYKYMDSIGLVVPKYISNGPCMTVSRDTVLVDPYGKLFKCVEMIGIDKLSVGSVFDSDYNQNISRFVGHPCFKECIKNDCKYVCLCGGGCLMKSYLKDKTLKHLDCQCKLFEELIPFLLELNYGNKPE